MSEFRVILCANLALKELPHISRAFRWGRCRQLDEDEYQVQGQRTSRYQPLFSICECHGIYNGLFGPYNDVPIKRNRKIPSIAQVDRVGICGCIVTRTDFSNYLSLLLGLIEGHACVALVDVTRSNKIAVSDTNQQVEMQFQEVLGDWPNILTLDRRNILIPNV